MTLKGRPVDIYRVESREYLLSCLVSSPMLHAYQQYLTEERASLVDAALIRHLEHLRQALQRLMLEGLSACSGSHLGDIDQVLTDIFAVATWNGWQVPVLPPTLHTLPEPRPACGLLASGEVGSGAHVWFHANHIFLSRDREIDRIADTGHWRP